MSKTISVEELPRKAERLLRTAWEGHESVVLERNDEPVAAIVPMDEYRRWHPDVQKADGKEPESKKTAEPPAPLAYELPADLLAEYHRLLDKKFSKGLTPEEEAEFERVGRELDKADMETPLERAADAKARREHKRRMAVLNDIIAKLKSLQQPE